MRYYGCNVILEGQEKPLFVLDNKTIKDKDGKKITVLNVVEFFCEGETTDVERILEGLTVLFDKPIGYP